MKFSGGFLSQVEQTSLGQEHPLWAGATFSLWCLLRMRSDPARRAPSHCHQYPGGKLTAGTCEMRRFEGNPLFSILNFQVLGSFLGCSPAENYQTILSKRKLHETPIFKNMSFLWGKAPVQHSYGLDDNPVPYFLKVFLVLLIARSCFSCKFGRHVKVIFQ